MVPFEDFIDLRVFLPLAVIFGLPLLFLILCIKNWVKVAQAKKNGKTYQKSWKVKAIIFGIIFALIIMFYLRAIYILNMSVANM